LSTILSTIIEAAGEKPRNFNVEAGMAWIVLTSIGGQPNCAP
jgi:hypothetical protein